MDRTSALRGRATGEEPPSAAIAGDSAEAVAEDLVVVAVVDSAAAIVGALAAEDMAADSAVAAMAAVEDTPAADTARRSKFRAKAHPTRWAFSIVCACRLTLNVRATQSSPQYYVPHSDATLSSRYLPSHADAFCP